jgi:hypothetical protein
MSGRAKIDLSKFGKIDLKLDISCQSSCDYAWTYWKYLGVM